MEGIKSFAPVVIPTLCRYQHFKNCIESLMKCKYASYTDVYICLDFPKIDAHKDGYYKILDYLNSIKHTFKNFKVVKREYNYGASKNVRCAYEDIIIKRYPYWIYSEDDNVFSYNFLEFVNINLLKYQNDESVCAINGYSFPIEYVKGSNTGVFRTYMYSPWGVGLWVSKNYRVSMADVDEFLGRKKQAFVLYKRASYLFEVLVSMKYSNVLYADSVFRAWCLINNKCCITPLISKVRNCGFDNSGVNCPFDGGRYAAQLIDDSVSENADIKEVEVNKLDDLYKKYFKLSFVRRLKSVVKYIIISFKK